MSAIVNHALAVEQVAIADLLPYARNARTHTDAQVAQVAASIREFGFTNPVLVDEAGTIIAGHCRVIAARRLGLASVPAIRIRGLTDAQRRALVLADNQLALNAGWNEDMLAAELAQLREEGFDLAVTGFDAGEIDRLLAAVDDPAVDGLVDDEAVPEAPAEPVTRPGDVWILGDHRLVCGDSTTPEPLRALMGADRADLLHTDPPYGVDYNGGWRNKGLELWGTDGARAVKNDRLVGDELVAFLVAALGGAVEYLKPGAPWYIWHGSVTTSEFYAAIAALKRKPQAQIIWAKNSFAGGFADYRNQHEPCIYVSGGKASWYGGRSESTLWTCDRDLSGLHPTMKPVALVERALRNSSKAGDIVLDLFGGSGSTLIAAHKLGRRARLVEIDPRFCDVIVERWEQFTGGKATRGAD